MTDPLRDAIELHRRMVTTGTDDETDHADETLWEVLDQTDDEDTAVDAAPAGREIVWGAPPPPATHDRLRLRPVVDTLRASPGEWARVGDVWRSPPTPGSLATRWPGTEWTTRAVPGGHGLWGRAIPDGETPEERAAGRRYPLLHDREWLTDQFETGRSSAAIGQAAGGAHRTSVDLALERVGLITREQRTTWVVPDEDLVARYHAGARTVDLARDVGKSPAAVRIRLMRAGATMRPDATERRVDPAEVLAAWQDGEDTAEIAGRLGVTPERIGQIVRGRTSLGERRARRALSGSAAGRPPLWTDEQLRDLIRRCATDITPAPLTSTAYTQWQASHPDTPVCATLVTRLGSWSMVRAIAGEIPTIDGTGTGR